MVASSKLQCSCKHCLIWMYYSLLVHLECRVSWVPVQQLAYYVSQAHNIMYHIFLASVPSLQHVYRHCYTYTHNDIINIHFTALNTSNICSSKHNYHNAIHHFESGGWPGGKVFTNTCTHVHVGVHTRSCRCTHIHVGVHTSM